MTPADVQRIQKQTGIQLPGFYIEAVTNYPRALTDTEAPDFGFLDDPEVIIEENLSVRQNGYFGEPWPSHYFIIGHNGCGDYYVMSTKLKSFTVGFSDHEKMSCDPYAESLDDFVEKLIAEME